MAKQPTTYRFECRACGKREAERLPQCAGCRAWDTLDKITATPSAGDVQAGVVRCTAAKMRPVKRLRTGLVWWDKALNGGVAAGQRVLLGGKQGGGKTRLCLQLAYAAAVKGWPVLFVSGEMDLRELQQTAGEINCAHKNILLTAMVDVDGLQTLLTRLKPRPVLVIVDSLNMLTDSSVRGGNGSPGQLRAGLRIGKWCQQHGIPSVFLAHLNAKDAVAGPRFLQHEVDVVALLTVEKDSSRKLRISKNRQGPETETRLRMTAKGLTP